MTKQELIDHIRANSAEPLTDRTIRAVLDGLANAVIVGLRDDEEAVLPGIGKLKVAWRAARTGRNPQTGERIEIPARPAAKFVPAKPFKTAIEEECA